MNKRSLAIALLAMCSLIPVLGFGIGQQPASAQQTPCIVRASPTPTPLTSGVQIALQCGPDGGLITEGGSSGGSSPTFPPVFPAPQPSPLYTTPVSGNVGASAVTGLGFTHYPATSLATAAPVAIQTSAATLAGVMVSWSAPSTATVCWISLYDSTAAPTVGTSPVLIAPINTSAAGAFAFAIPPTIGMKIVNGIWYAATTTATGSTACNTSSNQLWVSADYK